MSSINGFSPVQSDAYRTEVRAVIGESVFDKPTFGDKLKGLFLKAGSFLGGIAGILGKFIPGIGRFASTIGYGVKTLADKGLENMEIRKQQEAAINAQASAMSATPWQGWGVVMPGFQNQDQNAMASLSGGMGGLEWNPYAQAYQQDITNTLNNKNDAAAGAVDQMKATML